MLCMLRNVNVNVNVKKKCNFLDTEMLQKSFTLKSRCIKDKVLAGGCCCSATLQVCRRASVADTWQFCFLTYEGSAASPLKKNKK